jgi:hypothetical protein
MEMSESNWPGLVKSDDPDFNDPRFQRRVEALWRPIAIVENIHGARLECGHEPMLVGDKVPEVGMMCFCADCRNEARGLQ